ncbi:hypothetical protein AOLI_G00243110, partial [Acnodon oligacanthus]
MSCILFWRCGGRQSDSDTEDTANEAGVKKDGSKIKKMRSWITRKMKGHQKKSKAKDVERAEESQVRQQPAAGDKKSDAPHVPAGLGSGSSETVSSVIHHDLQIEAEASLHEKDADSDQLLENERLEKAAAEAEAEAIQELINIHLDEAEEKVENHLAADETTEAFLTEAEVEAVKTIMLQYIDQREAELL